VSGGSYNYLYIREPEDLAVNTEDLERMIDRLAGLGYAEDAAKETQELLLIVRQFRVRVSTIADRLSPVWRAQEWWDSNDWGEDDLKEALKKYRGENEPTIS
jgi:hypothetical protein